MTPQYLIWSYEHDRWWRPGGFGYTLDLDEAGRFSGEEAALIVAAANVPYREWGRLDETLVAEADALIFLKGRKTGA